MRQSPDTQKPIFQVLADGLDASVDGRGWTAEHEAAKNLANAAPELLEALKLAEATLERLAPAGFKATQGTRDVISAAIAKAEGRHV